MCLNSENIKHINKIKNDLYNKIYYNEMELYKNLKYCSKNVHFNLQ